MKRTLLTTLLLLVGCASHPVYSPPPPDINPYHAGPRPLNVAFPLPSTSTIPAASLAVVRVELTGSGAEWSMLPFATNWLFTALVSNDLFNWMTNHPVLNASHSFYVTDAPPFFVNAYWQPKP